MPLPQGSGRRAAAFALAGLLAAFALPTPCLAFPLFPNKHQGPGQPVYLLQQPQVQAMAPVVPTSGVVVYTGSAPAVTASAPTLTAGNWVYSSGTQATTANAPVATTGNWVFTNNGQAATTSNAPTTGQAPTGTTTLSTDDQNEIVQQLREQTDELKGSTRRETFESLRDRAIELIGEARGNDGDPTPDDRRLAARLARLAMNEPSTGSAPLYPMIGAAGGAAYPYSYPVQAAPTVYVLPTLIQPVVPVQLVAPAPPHHHHLLHHLLCPCASCRSRRGY